MDRIRQIAIVTKAEHAATGPRKPLACHPLIFFHCFCHINTMISQKRYPKIFRCEFSPPNTDAGMRRLFTAREELMRMRPTFFSVTYGAGGSIRERTFEAIQAIQAHSGVDAAPHLTCVASTCTGIREILDHYRAQGIRRIVALRGDLPSGMREFGEFRYANELVEFIRAETGDYFHIEVAAHP